MKEVSSLSRPLVLASPQVTGQSVWGESSSALTGTRVDGVYVVIGGGHQHLVIQQDLVPLLDSHGTNVQGTGFEIMFDGLEKLIVIVGRKARICQGIFTKYMISVEDLLVQTVSASWLDSSL